MGGQTGTPDSGGLTPPGGAGFAEINPDPYKKPPGGTGFAEINSNNNGLVGTFGRFVNQGMPIGFPGGGPMGGGYGGPYGPMGGYGGMGRFGTGGYGGGYGGPYGPMGGYGGMGRFGTGGYGSPFGGGGYGSPFGGGGYDLYSGFNRGNYMSPYGGGRFGRGYQEPIMRPAVMPWRGPTISPGGANPDPPSEYSYMSPGQRLAPLQPGVNGGAPWSTDQDLLNQYIERNIAMGETYNERGRDLVPTGSQGRFILPLTDREIAADRATPRTFM